VAHLVCIVDDDPDYCQIAEKHLGRAGLSVITFAQGRPALERLKSDPLPSLITIDVSLPDMSGFELCHHVLNDPRTRHIPVLVVSARAGPENHARAEEVGAKAYVEKPVRGRDLVDAITAHLDEVA
jgi:CheY-like chemotaxis protein